MYRAKSDWTEGEKALWWERYHRENRGLVIVPAAPLSTEVEAEYDPTTWDADPEAFGPEPSWGPEKGDT